MRHTLKFLIAFLSIPAAAHALDPVLDLPFVEENSRAIVKEEQALFSNQCNKMAWKYSERIQKVSKKSNSPLKEAPLLVFASEKKGQKVKTLVHGKVTTSNGQRYIEVTQTFLPYGSAQTMKIKAPQGPSIVSLPAVPGGEPLQLHFTENCAKVAHANSQVPFQCGSSNNVTKSVAQNPDVKDISYQNNLVDHFPYIADFHQKNIGAKAKLTKPYERGISECLNSQRKVSFDRQKVFNKFFPGATFQEKKDGNGGGFGGGTTGAKVVSR